MTTPRPSDKHRTAEEVAENVAKAYFFDKSHEKPLYDYVLEALTSYAAAKVEEALERAAMVVETIEREKYPRRPLVWKVDGYKLVAAIRALKTGRAGEGESK